MIGLLIVAHGSLGESLIQSAAFVLGERPAGLGAIDLMSYPNTDAMLAAARGQIETLDTGDGVLVLTDMYGATPCNIVCKLLRPGKLEAVAGVNLPMLLKALSNRHEDIALLAGRVANGGRAAIIHIRFDHCDA